MFKRILGPRNRRVRVFVGLVLLGLVGIQCVSPGDNVVNKVAIADNGPKNHAQVLDHLRGRTWKLEDNTIVVATTDHGDMVGAHRMWIKGWIPYEECYRVPLIVRWPGRITPGSRTDRLVQTHDLAYTYVAAAGARPMP
jgi:hypothetical protein